MRKIFAFFVLVSIGLFFLPPVVLATTTSETTKPEDNPMCWALEQCEHDWDNDSKLDGTFADDSDKKSQETCGPELGFCYNNNDDFELSVSLPITGEATTTVGDLGDYISKMYLLLLGVSFIIVIVTLMMSGFQYVVSPGGGEISKAKERIKTSLIGLVLLMAASLLLATVNPQLLNLNIFLVPKSRTVLFFGDNMKCEKLKELGFVFDEDKDSTSSATCGLTSQVIKDSKGMDLVEPFECIWTGCEGTDYSLENSQANFRVNKVCTLGAKTNGSTGKAACISCEDIIADTPFPTGLGASSQLCSTLTPTPVFASTLDTTGWHTECVMTRDVGFELTEPLDVLTNGECAVVAYDCNNINSCGDYDKIQVRNSDGETTLDAFVMSHPFDYSKHQTICEGNPCKNSSKPELQTGCHQDFSESFITARSLAAAVSFGGSEIALVEWDALTGSAVNGLSCEPNE